MRSMRLNFGGPSNQFLGFKVVIGEQHFENGCQHAISWETWILICSTCSIFVQNIFDWWNSIEYKTCFLLLQLFITVWNWIHYWNFFARPIEFTKTLEVHNCGLPQLAGFYYCHFSLWRVEFQSEIVEKVPVEILSFTILAVPEKLL